MKIIDFTSEQFAEYCIENNIENAIFIRDSNGGINCSPNQAKELIPVITSADEWKDHEAVCLNIDPQTNCIYIVCIHKTRRGRSEGGVRIVNPSQANTNNTFYFKDGLNDCLALAYGMTLKNAYADIWEGGAKSVIIPFNDNTFDQLRNEQAKSENDIIGTHRDLLWQNYSRFILKLQGVYIIGEDMNLNSWDMRGILKYIVHSSCHDKSVGGAGNPSPKTALGVFRAIESASEIIYRSNNGLHKKRVLIKGLGQVGAALSTLLLNAGCEVFAYDLKKAEEITPQELLKQINYRQTKTLEEELNFIKEIDPDIFSPNAKSGTLTKEVVNCLVSKSNIKLIAGGENAQIARKDTTEIVNMLHYKGIIYLPEAAINYMGVFSAYQEHNGILYADFERVANEIYTKTKDILSGDKAPYYMFEEYALVKSDQLNPLFNYHRSAEIIKEVFANWESKK